MPLRAGLDTNVLVYAHLAGLPEHSAVSRYLAEALEEDDTMLAVTPLVLHELVHVITDPRRFTPAVGMSEALELARLYLNRTNVECLPVDEAAVALMLELMSRANLGRKRVPDTLLAATLLSHGVDRLITCNPGDFSAFDGLEVVDPR